MSTPTAGYGDRNVRRSLAKTMLLRGMPSYIRRPLEIIAGFVILLAAWTIVADISNPLLLPGPLIVAGAAGALVRNGLLWQDLLASLSRIAVGYAIGVVVGTFLGLCMGEIDLLHRVFSPIVGSLRVLPGVALIPLAIIWFGIGEGSKYFVIAYGVTVVCLFSAVDGVHRVPRNRILAVRCMGASRIRTTFDVVIPSAIPYIWTGMKIGLGIAIASVVAAELIAANTGIGALIMQAQTLVQTDQMFVGLVVLSIVGGLIDLGFTIAGSRLLSRFIDYTKA